MTCGFVAPAAGFGIGDQGFRIGALRRQDWPEGPFRPEVRAVFADVGVGSGALGRRP